MSQKKHSHNFVETYKGIVAFGLSREIDEKSLIYYLQKFTDDELMKLIVPRLSDEEINALFESISRILKTHLTEEEYHTFFLKD